jgi:hypothetical protein
MGFGTNGDKYYGYIVTQRVLDYECGQDMRNFRE